MQRSRFHSVGPGIMEAYEGQSSYASRGRSRTPRSGFSRFHSVGPGVMEAFEGQPLMRADRMNRSRAAKKIQTAQRNRRNKRRTNAARRIQSAVRGRNTRRLKAPPSRYSSRRGSLPRSSSRRSSLPRSSSRRTSLSRQNSHQKFHQDVVQSRKKAEENIRKTHGMQSRLQSAPVKGSPDYSRHIRESLMREKAELKRLRGLKAQKDREEERQRRSQMRTMYGQPFYDVYGAVQYDIEGKFIPPSERLRRTTNIAGKSGFTYSHRRLG